MEHEQRFTYGRAQKEETLDIIEAVKKNSHKNFKQTTKGFESMGDVTIWDSWESQTQRKFTPLT